MTMLLSQPQMLENLRLAVEGEYDIILNLLSCLDAGKASKSLVDAAIDQCENYRRYGTFTLSFIYLHLGDSVINLREDILNHRINLALAAMDEQHRSLHLNKTLAGLERYFFLVAFASYIAETDIKPGLKYSEWLLVSRNRACIAHANKIQSRDELSCATWLRE